MTKKELMVLIDNRINEVYFHYQNAENIESGDILPDDAIAIGNLEEQLADLIIKSMEHNKVKFEVGDIVEFYTAKALVTAINYDDSLFVIFPDGSTDTVLPPYCCTKVGCISKDSLELFLNMISTGGK